MEESILGLIRTRYNTLSPAQKKVADYVLANPKNVMLRPLSALARSCETSETTIIRLLRKLDYDSYQVFRVMIAQELSADSATSVYEEVKSGDDVGEIKRKVIDVTISSIKDLDSILDENAITDFVDSLLQSRRTVFMGVGASSMIASDAYHKFLRLGLYVTVCVDSHIMIIQSAHLDKDDLVLAVSHSGESREILDAVSMAKRKGARIAAITSYERSSLAKLADIVLLSSSREAAYRSDAMISRIIQLVIIDTLYVATVLTLGPAGIKRVNQSRLAVAKNKT